MKKFLTLFVFGVLVSFVSNAQYTETKDLTPLGFSGNFIQVVSLKNNHILALANNDCLYESADSAKTWTVKKAPFKEAKQMKKFNDNDIYLYNAETIYKSSDNGSSWSLYETNGIPKILESYKMEYENLFYKNEDTLFITATNRVNGSKLYRTTNGGKEWSLVAENLYGKNISTNVTSLHFVSQAKGYAFGAGYYAETTDGGSTWTKTILDNYETYFYAGIVQNGILIQSYASSSSSIPDIEDVVWYKAGIYRFLSSEETVIGNWEQAIHKTYNEGQTWNVKKNEINDYFRDICCIDKNVIIQVGKNLTSYVTTDGGETWTKYVHGGGEGFSYLYDGLYVKSDNEVFVGGNTGRLFHTSDGGETWSWQDIYTNSLHGIVFPSKDTGYIVSNKGILKTIDGGKSWIVNTTKGDYPYIDFPTNDCGYLGYSVNTPALYKTSNGGTSVKPMYTAVYGDNKTGLEPFSFMTEKKGLVCADNGNMLYTADGGKTWELKNTGFGDNELMESIVSVGKQGWLLNILNEETTKIYYIDTLFNVSIVHEFDEDEGEGYYLKKVNDSLFYISMYKDGERTLYFGNLIEWHKTSIPVKSATYAYNEHVVYAYDANTTTIYKTIVYDDSLQVSLQKESSYKYTLFSNVQNVLLNLSLTNSTGEIIWSGRIISENGETTIDFPETIEQGSYLLKIEPEQGYYYKTTEPIEVILKADDTPITEVSPEKSYTLYGKILYVYDTNAKLYSALGIEIPVQHGYIELKAGVYILVNGNETYKIVIQ